LSFSRAELAAKAEFETFLIVSPPGDCYGFRSEIDVTEITLNLVLLVLGDPSDDLRPSRACADLEFVSRPHR
jgi:hypothetical protein